MDEFLNQSGEDKESQKNPKEGSDAHRKAMDGFKRQISDGMKSADGCEITGVFMRKTEDGWQHLVHGVSQVERLGVGLSILIGAINDEIGRKYKSREEE